MKWLDVPPLVAAMEYVIEQKVDIINLSLYARTMLATMANLNYNDFG